ncbi:SAM-dependent methyltransferase [Clostridium botulinum]|uniref:Methyltransferase n=1 Tax=Clostridium botulinum TaxID=1491 RepID=A0A6B4JL70_CLOBO|nr:methyltransferase [Clostridium botulinum]EES50698.1 methyltransferase [Clostridium botulinum E1 str. 'BoNT E Beluga']MBY6760948.1 methyltransferase [Clostridium botulinum]MBY6919760.1 methyltransferase [Clostridium botulinum]MCR1130739.1 SAM-dependent methyltransferase [Clostridium botulinum]NFH69355.1 methyltransferase [Clostridium botulinum]
MEEQYYENILNIKTSGKQELEEATRYYNRYEPTDYQALNKLFEEYKLNNTDSVVDFGCGKGRLNFYLNYLFKCNITGIEMNKYFYKQALINKKYYLEKYNIDENKINFVCELAEKYEVKPEDNKFYFFNPFSIEIFMKVIDNIIGSVYENKRNIEIILFYPSDDYIVFLEQYTFFIIKKEVRLENFKNDSRDRFVIYKLAYI